MPGTKLNIACGDTYIDDWVNFDYDPHSRAVRKADILQRIPVIDGNAELLYSSHFLEHIPFTKISPFIADCYRVLSSGGVLRVVLPDWGELCKTFLNTRRIGEHEKADFLMLEMLDQCVRLTSGGALGEFYQNLSTSYDLKQNMIEYVKQRTGHCVQRNPVIKRANILQRLLRNPSILSKSIELIYCRVILSLLPKAFRHQNVSLANTGERHAWMYDFYTIEKILLKAGFTDVQRMTSSTSRIPGFPFFPLDVTQDGLPRKGLESMYIEAIKP